MATLTIEPAVAGPAETPNAWRGFSEGPWSTAIDVRDFIQRELHPLPRRRELPGRSHRAHHRASGTPSWRCSRTSARRASTTSTPPRPPASPPTPRATSTATTSSSSACRPTPRSSARSCPTAAGAWCETALETYGYEVDPVVKEIFTKYRKTHNQGVFDVYPPTSGGPAARTSSPACRTPTAAAASSATTAGSPSTASTRLIAAQEGREGRARRGSAASRTSSATARRTSRADPRADRAQGDGRVLRLRHLRPGRHRPRGRPVAVLRLPRRGEGAERRGHVAGPHLDLPRRLPRARPRRGPPHRDRGAGDRSTTSSSSCASSASCAPPSTTSCSPATRPGSPSPSAASARTAGRW